MKLDEKRSHYPRVSEIIAKQNEEFRRIPIEILANAAERGTKIHAYCTAHAKGLWLDGIEEEYQPYVNSFIKWYDQNVSDLIDSELRLYDDERIFTGEIDMLVKMKDNKIVLVDIKTSHTKSKTWSIQLAAYAHLCNISTDYKIDNIINLHLKKTHAALYETKEEAKIMVSAPIVKVDIIEQNNISHYWDLFESALKCYNFFNKESK
jgi:hypothetical protein